jgi:hypothetical protein
MAHQESVNLTPDQLQSLITTAVTAAVAAAKTPSIIEQQQIDERKKEIEERQKDRLNTAKEHIEAIKSRRWVHENCSHEHKNGDTHCVWIQEKSGPGYLICQKNQCIIRPGQMPADYKGTAVFNTELFNSIFQKLPSGELFS